MIFGKKYRYIEVFQCSGDDMNLVLNGGLHTPPSKPSLLSPGMLPQTPQATQSSPSPGLPMNIPPPLTLSLSQPAAASLLAQQQAQFIAQQNLLARQQAINAAAANVATAAAAAHAQSHASVDQTQYYLPNMGLLSSSAGVPSVGQTHLHLSQMAAGHPPPHHNHGMPNTAQPPYPYLMRQGMPHSHALSAHMNQMGMGYLPQQFHHSALSLLQQNAMHSQFNAQQQSQSPMTPVSVAAAAAAAVHAATSMANTPQHHYQFQSTVSMPPTNMIPVQSASYKRSYESAFHDPTSVAVANASATKRFLSRPAPNIYAPFYPPGL